MAWGRKKSGGRKEPQFGLAAALSELRLSPQDRVTVSEDKPKKSSAKRKSENEDDEPPRERKPRAGRSGAKRRSTSRGGFRIGRLFYWGAVLGLWVAIAIVGGRFGISSDWIAGRCAPTQMTTPITAIAAHRPSTAPQ